MDKTPCVSLLTTYRTRHCHDVHNKKIYDLDLGKVSFICTSQAHDVCVNKRQTTESTLHRAAPREEPGG